MYKNIGGDVHKKLGPYKLRNKKTKLPARLSKNLSVTTKKFIHLI